MKIFGEIMMKLYSKTHDYRKNDFSLNYLGLAYGYVNYFDHDYCQVPSLYKIYVIQLLD